MGIEALTHDDAGNLVVPTTSEEWSEWVSASLTRNYVLENPLIDWLDRYGEERGFVRDEVSEAHDFGRFIMNKGIAFEQAVVEHLSGLIEVRTILPEDSTREMRQGLEAAEATFAAMTEGAPIIAQGSLRDPQTRTYGAPDLLIRSDVMAELFPGSISAQATAVAAPDLGGRFHYRVVDIKCSTLSLAAGGELGNSGSSPAYKVQIYLYNRALGRLQGYWAPESFVLGRGWTQTRRKVTTRSDNCMDRLAPIPNSYASRKSGPLATQADAAVEWVRRLRREGADWSPLPEPSVQELRPNATGEGGEWASAVKEIVQQSEDLTRLWWVGAQRRDEANATGLLRWTDPRVTPDSLGLTSPDTVRTLQALLDVNREPGEAVRPARIEAARNEWIEPTAAEFYVDFETVGNLDDDFSRIPEQNGQPIIFMVGCGHLEEGEWQFECFIADRLDQPSEGALIDAWFEHMIAVRDRLAPGIDPESHPLGAARAAHPGGRLRRRR